MQRRRATIKAKQLAQVTILGMEESKAIAHAERLAKQAVDIAVQWRFCSYQPPPPEKQGFEIFYPKKLDVDYPATNYKGTGQLLTMGFLYVWFDAPESFNVFIGRNPDGTERFDIIMNEDIEITPGMDWADSIAETYIPLGSLMRDTKVKLTDEERKLTHELIHVRWAIVDQYRKTAIGEDGTFDMKPGRAFVLDYSEKGMDGDVLIAAEQLPEWHDVEALQAKLDRYNTTPDYEPDMYFTKDGRMVVKYAPGSNDAYAAHVMMSTYTANGERIHFNMAKCEVERRTPPRRVDSPVASSTPPESPARELTTPGRGGKSPYRKPKSPKKATESEDGWTVRTKTSPSHGSRGGRGQKTRK